MELEQQQKILTNVLPILRLYDYDLVIAGGCPRDWYFGNPCKDIDIYLNTPNSPQELEHKLEYLSYALGSSFKDKTKENEDPRRYAKLDNGIVRVLECTLDGLTMDFILTKNEAHKAPNSFCCSLSNISLDLDSLIPLPTSSFMSSVNSNKAVYYGDITEDHQYYKRMVEKFPKLEHILAGDSKDLKRKTKQAYVRVPVPGPQPRMMAHPIGVNQQQFFRAALEDLERNGQ